MSTVLGIATDAADALGLQRPASLFGTYDEGDTSDRKLLRCLTQTARFLAATFDWAILKNRHSFTLLGQEEQTAGIPADLLRMEPGTIWDTTLKRQIVGPLSGDEWAMVVSRPIALVEPVFAIFGGVFHVRPTTATGRTVEYTYVSNAIGTNAAGARIAAFGADTDAALWDDELMTLGLVYQFRKLERFDYAQDELDFKTCLQDRIKRDGGGKILHMGDNHRTSADIVARMKQAALFIQT